MCPYSLHSYNGMFYLETSYSSTRHEGGVALPSPFPASTNNLQPGTNTWRNSERPRLTIGSTYLPYWLELT
jgi:hypothetical protein